MSRVTYSSMHHSNSPQQRRALGAMEAAASSSSSSHGDEGVRLQRTVERLQALVVRLGLMFKAVI